MKNKTIVVFGGSGFLGKHVVQVLAEAGYRVKITCRDIETAKHTLTAGNLGQIAVISGNVSQQTSIDENIAGAYAVVNLVGLLFEKRKQNFQAVHVEAAQKIAASVKRMKVEKLIHISALGVEKALDSSYAKTKLAGEEAVRTVFSDAVILRPSVIFGAGDNFFNQFAKMARFFHVLPLIGGGYTKFQPVYVHDVAKAVLKAIENPDAAGKTYEITGPEIIDFRGIYRYIIKTTNAKAMQISIPFKVAEIVGAVLNMLPTPPLTRDQVRLLKVDNIRNKDSLGLLDLGITPTAIDAVVPNYLRMYA